MTISPEKDVTVNSTLLLARDGGRIAYDVQGNGPLVICAPGMGDLRQTFRYLVPAVVEAGYRVATFDIRGHGESDLTFTSYDDEAEASDILALIDHLGGPATVVGNSMGSAAGIIAAAERPELVSGLVLAGAYARNPKVNPFMKALMWVALAPAWAASVWKSYLPKLYAGTPATDQDQYLATVIASLRAKGYGTGFSKTARTTTHAPAEAALPRVSAPAIVVMGALDPDFAKPTEEAAWIGEQLGGQVLMVPEAGHYPLAQRPEITNQAVLTFLASINA
jgi:pimeloyl-ACP methyl ester carboxylesterase